MCMYVYIKCSFQCFNICAEDVLPHLYLHLQLFVFVGDNDKKYRNDQHDCTEYGDEIYGGDQDDNMKKGGVYE